MLQVSTSWIIHDLLENKSFTNFVVPKNDMNSINNLRYVDDTTLMAENEEELKNLLMKVTGESEKVGLKLNTQKTKIMASSLITARQIGRETMETVRDFIFLGSKISADGDCSHEIKRCSLEEKSWPTQTAY